MSAGRTSGHGGARIAGALALLLLVTTLAWLWAREDSIAATKHGHTFTTKGISRSPGQPVPHHFREDARPSDKRAKSGGSRRAKAPSAAKPSKPGKGRPNILVVMTDDQTQASQKFLETVNQRVGNAGAVFRDSFASNPLCCPSRATFLTGQYSRNNHVQTNSLPDGGYLSLDNKNTLPVWLQKSGYYTTMIGKYLNGYDHEPQPQTIPPGWTNWQVATRTYAYYRYQLNQNGRLVDYGSEPEDYQTDVYTQKALKVIDKQADARKPWFMWLAYLAPHNGGPNPSPQPPGNCDGSAKPAVRDADAYDSEPLPEPPSFNEGDVSDKPSFIADNPILDQDQIDDITRQYRCRLGSLDAVDDGVDQLIDKLRSTGQLDDTYVIFTSDNGFFAGEHRIPSGKRRAYEPSIRVPLQIRGPGIKPGTDVKDLAVNADLAPTIAKLAGAKPGLKMDGRPLMPLWRNPSVQRGRQLLLSGTRKRYTGLRNRRYLYVRYVDGQRELYDLRGDQNELANIYGNPAYAAAQQAIEQQFEKLRHCKAARCQKGPGVGLLTVRRDGPAKPCKRRPISVRAVHKGGGIEGVLFQVNGGSAISDLDPPFEVSIPKTATGKVVVDARVDMLDGRRVTLRASPGTCD